MIEAASGFETSTMFTTFCPMCATNASVPSPQTSATLVPTLRFVRRRARNGGSWALASVARQGMSRSGSRRRDVMVLVVAGDGSREAGGAREGPV